MSKNKDDDQFDMDADSAFSGPIRLRRELRAGTTRSRSVSRRKVNTTRRKGGKPGGIHQRANKRMNW